jgi:tRNA G18 (ribose-2'-O)-methylase SpoU
MNIQHVQFLEDERLTPYRTLRRPVEHQHQGIFVGEGEKVVRRLLTKKFEIISLLLTPEWLEALKTEIERLGDKVQILVAPKKVVEEIVGFNLHQGIMAVARIPQLQTVDEILKDLPHPCLLVAIDSLTNAENIGVLVRNCAGLNVHALLVGETSSSPYLRRAVRNSMGTVFQLNIVHVENLASVLSMLHSKHGIITIAAHPHAEGKTLYDIDLTGDCCLVFGSEGQGLSRSVLDACIVNVTLPMGNGVDSLNVASAAAVFLYEAQRQRRKQ